MALPAARVVIIVALNDVVANAGELIVPARGAPLIVIRELTNNEAVILIVYEI
ncbi:hypothetical protein B4077_4555 [Bacillus cereus]|uniref:Uncharacterized protein n=1 Tax=Bacillus cereus TaxID=1396 RepID=A0A0G8EK10_BACCE|nr:hypothetical protein [Bacillus wiedmannii]KLA24561.1 hypothetical protein B4077_4555 [Bacillus cereus]